MSERDEPSTPSEPSASGEGLGQPATMEQVAAPSSPYKRAFVAGLGTILPTIVTLWILGAAYNFIDDSIARPLSETIKTFLVTTSVGNDVAYVVLDVDESLTEPIDMSTPPLASDLAREAERQRKLGEQVDERYPAWFGLVAAVIVIFAIGFLVAGLLGQRLVAVMEGALVRLPLIRAIYPSAKQVVDFFLAAEESRKSFSKVVAVQWPRSGYWAVGFVTSGGLQEVQAANDGRMFVHVFVPNSPTPMTGYVFLAPVDELIFLSMTVDQAFRYLLSAGVILPPGQEVPMNEEMMATSKSSRLLQEREAGPPGPA